MGGDYFRIAVVFSPGRRKSSVSYLTLGEKFLGTGA
jgi:hypothetical protein